MRRTPPPPPPPPRHGGEGRGRGAGGRGPHAACEPPPRARAARDAHRLADGGDRMRRRLPRDDPRLLRPLGASRRAADPVRRVARRGQGGQRAAGGARVRPPRDRLPARSGGPVRPPLPDGAVLELQPLPRAGGDPGRGRLRERSERGPAPDLHAGVRRGVHRGLPRVRPRPGLPPRRREAEPVARARLPDRQRAFAAPLRRPRDPLPGGPRPRDPDDLQGVRGRRAGPPQREPADAPPHRPRERPPSSRASSPGSSRSVSPAWRPSSRSSPPRASSGTW